MKKFRILIIINIFMFVVMALFIFHYYHFYYHWPMMSYYSRKNTIEQCHNLLISNFSEEEIQTMSLLQLLKRNENMLHNFISTTKEFPNLKEIWDNDEMLNEYIGYELLTNNEKWFLVEKYSSEYKQGLAINNNGKIFEIRKAK